MKRAILASVVVVVLAAGIMVGVWPSGKARAAGTVTLTLNQTVLVASNVKAPTTEQPLPGTFITQACPHPSFIVDAPGSVSVYAHVGGLTGQVQDALVGGASGGKVGVPSPAPSAPSLTFSVVSAVNGRLNNLYLFCGP